jgi:hypothetical protein
MKIHEAAELQMQELLLNWALDGHELSESCSGRFISVYSRLSGPQCLSGQCEENFLPRDPPPSPISFLYPSP